MLFLLSQSAQAIIGAEINPSRNDIAAHTVLLLNTQNQSTHQRCTGTLIAKNIVLTAAHCIPTSLEQFWVVTSMNEAAVSQRHPVSKVIVHPKFNFYSYENFDIALVQFAGPLPVDYRPTAWMTTQIWPVDFNDSQIFLTAAGYGETAKGRGDSGELRIARLRIFNFKKWSFQFIADQTTSQGICFGDSGGPAYLKLNGEYFVLGIASAILAQDAQGLPTAEACAGTSFFNSTIYYQDWIQSAQRQLDFTAELGPISSDKF